MATACMTPSKMNGTQCATLALIADTCSKKYGESMASMGGCKNYNFICNGTASQPAQCEADMSKNLPTTAAIQAAIAAICTSKTSTACPSPCQSSGSTMTGMRRAMSFCLTYTLDVLSDLCTESRTNANCASWVAWCTDNPVAASYYCSRAPPSKVPSSAARGSRVPVLLVAMIISLVTYLAVACDV